MNPEILILHSGGADSRLLCERAILEMAYPRRAVLLHCCWDYPAADQEMEAFEKTNPFFQEHVVLTLPMEGQPKNGEDGPRVVPARNMLMLAAAINYASAHGIPTIWYGACADDNQAYLDCREELGR